MLLVGIWFLYLVLVGSILLNGRPKLEGYTYTCIVLTRVPLIRPKSLYHYNFSSGLRNERPAIIFSLSLMLSSSDFTILESSTCFYRSYESHQIPIIVLRLSHLNGSSPPILLFRELIGIVDTTMCILLKPFSYDIIEIYLGSLSFSFPFSRCNLKASQSL